MLKKGKKSKDVNNCHLVNTSRYDKYKNVAYLMKVGTTIIA